MQTWRTYAFIVDKDCTKSKKFFKVPIFRGAQKFFFAYILLYNPNVWYYTRSTNPPLSVYLCIKLPALHSQKSLKKSLPSCPSYIACLCCRQLSSLLLTRKRTLLFWAYDSSYAADKVELCDRPKLKKKNLTVKKVCWGLRKGVRSLRRALS